MPEGTSGRPQEAAEEGHGWHVPLEGQELKDKMPQTYQPVNPFQQR